MHPRDWLLIFLRPTDVGASQALDPIRIQKGMFYLSREPSTPPAQRYDFVPYYYGPCSFSIYSDIDQLIGSGLIEPVPVPGQSWRKYRLTEAGLEQAAKLAATAGPRAVETCAAARSRVTNHTFRSLLKEVYEQYPEYAVKSVANLP